MDINIVLKKTDKEEVQKHLYINRIFLHSFFYVLLEKDNKSVTSRKR